MAVCLLGYVNHVLTGVLTAGSEQAGLTVGNLDNQHGSAAFGWRTAQGVRTSEAGAWFQVDAGAASARWRAFCVARTNLTGAATWRVRVGNSGTMASWNWDSGVVPASVAAGIGQAVASSSAETAGRYCRVELWDAANPDNFLSVPLAFAGPAWQPEINFAPETAMALSRGQQVVRTRGGGTYVTPLYRERSWTVAFDAVPSSEVWAQLVPAEVAASDGRNVLFVPDPAASTRQRETVFGPLETVADIGFATLDGQRRTWRARIAERL